jgi:Domain of unknown function (DUF4352)
MSEYMPEFAPVVVLAFLGTVLLSGLSMLVLLYAAIRRSSFFAACGAFALVAIVSGYALLLCAVSLSSTEKTLPVGGRKYFCEIDCHLAYSVANSSTSQVIGPELQQTVANGKFVIVRMRIWFDEHTISAHRGNSPLTPNRRRIVLVDDTGRNFAPSIEGEAAWHRVQGPGTPITEPLRPGESYTTDLVFDVPKDARGLRLLITDDDSEARLIIGHENSFLHKKIYLGLEAPATSNSTSR